MFNKIKKILKRKFLRTKLGKIYTRRRIKKISKKLSIEMATIVPLNAASVISFEEQMERVAQLMRKEYKEINKLSNEEKLKIKLEIIARRTKSQRIRKKNLKRLVDLLEVC